MHVIRPAALKDEEALLSFALAAELGLLNLPRDSELIHQKVLRSISSFSARIHQPGDELYLFVMENTKTGKVEGTAAIYAKMRMAFCYLLQLYHTHSSLSEVPRILKILHPVCYSETPSEVGGLYLIPELRKEGLGKLLSLSRFLFISRHLSRFSKLVITEMRGMIDDQNRSPFWESLGRHFLNRELSDALDVAIYDKQLISEFLPKHPIYVSFLSKEAQAAIGEPHKSSRGALKILQDEGFLFTGEVDIFDGGPKFQAVTTEISSIKNCKKGMIEQIRDEAIESVSYIITNNSTVNYRSCYGQLLILSKGKVEIPRIVCDALHLSLGDEIHYIPIKH
jgi:arginine N-succinyltransferase